MSISWTSYEDEFAAWSLDTARTEAKQGKVAVDDIDRFVSSPQKSSDLQQKLEQVWLDPESWPDRAGLQAYYLYLRCLKSWEFSIDHDSIGELIDVGQRAWRSATDSAEGWQSIDVLVQHTEKLKVCMKVENSLMCSCPADLATQARQVVYHSRAQLSSLARIDTQGPFEKLVEHILQVHICYFGALAAMGDALHSVLIKKPDAIVELSRSLEILSAAEHSPLLAESLYAPPLRAHHRLLDTCRGRLQDPSLSELDIRDAQVTYVYPFTLEGCEPPRNGPHRAGVDQAGDIARTLWGAGHRGSGEALDGDIHFSDANAVEMPLTDIWSLPESGSHGTVVKMPSVEITTTAPNPERPGQFADPLTHDVEIWLARFGNHHVRIQTPLMALSLHEMNQALRRGSQWMGPEMINGGPPGCSGLAEYVEKSVKALAEQLESELRQEGGSVRTRPEPQVRAHLDVDADYHAVVEIRAASVRENGGERRATIADIKRLAGSLLFQPIERLPITLEEWMCSRTPTNVPNMLGEGRFDNDFAGRTTSTTVLFLPETPTWGYLSLMEMAEYTATLPALFRMWRRQLDQKHTDALDQLSRWRDSGKGKRNRRNESEIEKTRLDLSEFTARIRAQHILLSSTDLVHSDTHRTFLDNFMNKADIPRSMAELDRQIEQTDQLYEYMVDYERTLEEKRRRRFERVVEIVLGSVAVLSLAGLFSYIHSLRLGGGNYSVGMESDEWGEFWVFVGICALGSIILAFFVWRRR